MQSIADCCVRPKKAAPTFTEEALKRRAEYVRDTSATIARLSWRLDEALRDVRRAETAEARASYLRVAEEVHRDVNLALHSLGID